MQIFSSQPRLVKYAYLPNKRAVEGKLNHVIQQLETLTQKVWDLQAGSDAGDSEYTSCHLHLDLSLFVCHCASSCKTDSYLRALFDNNNDM